MKVQVIINEQHILTKQQTELLNQVFEDNGWELFPAPAEGWDKNRIFSLSVSFRRSSVCFVSPVPLLLALLCSYREAVVYLLHNDKRNKKEISDGKGGTNIIYTVSQYGWEIIRVSSL